MIVCTSNCRRAAALFGALLLGACATTPQTATPTPGTSSNKTGTAESSSISTTPIASASVSAGVDYSAADQRFQNALKLLKDKQNAKAKDAFAALAKDYPTLTGPLTDLGILQAQGKQKEAAFQSFAQAVQADPKNAVAYNWLGTLYREHGDFAQAEQAYRKALAARSDYPLAHYNLGLLYDVYLHRPKDAISEYSAYLTNGGTEDLKVRAWIKALQPQPVPGVTG